MMLTHAWQGALSNVVSSSCLGLMVEGASLVSSFYLHSWRRWYWCYTITKFIRVSENMEKLISEVATNAGSFRFSVWGARGSNVESFYALIHAGNSSISERILLGKRPKLVDCKFVFCFFLCCLFILICSSCGAIVAPSWALIKQQAKESVSLSYWPLSKLSEVRCAVGWYQKLLKLDLSSKVRISHLSTC